jgi:hypothetical protein
MVLGRNWPGIVHKYDLQYNDMVVFKSQAFVLKMNIYKTTLPPGCTPALTIPMFICLRLYVAFPPSHTRCLNFV